MMTIARPTAGTLLGGDRPRIRRDWLADSLHEHRVTTGALGGVKGLTGAAVHILDDELAAVIHHLLDIDLGSLVTDAWKKAGELRAAAERSLASGEELVALATHRITSRHHPRVDIVIDGATRATLTLDLSIVLDIAEAVAVVRGGKLVGLRSGDCQATATLAAGREQLAEHTAHFDLGVLVRLTSALPLVNGAHQSSTAPRCDPLPVAGR